MGSNPTLSAIRLLGGAALLEEPVRRAWQAQVLAQGGAFVLAAEQAAALQLRHYLVHEVVQPGLVYEVANEVDKILDKVLKQGAGSLTSREKELMNKYSKMKH